MDYPPELHNTTSPLPSSPDQLLCDSFKLGMAILSTLSPAAGVCVRGRRVGRVTCGLTTGVRAAERGNASAAVPRQPLHLGTASARNLAMAPVNCLLDWCR